MQADRSVLRTKVRPNLREVAYRRITQHLLTGGLASGQFVSQRELVELTGLPLAAIREAVPRLEAERLLETVPQRGMQIASVDLRMVREVFQLWAILAKAAAEAFGRTAPDALIDELKLAHGKMLHRAAHAPGEDLPDDARELEYRFHDALIGAMENDIIADVYRINMIKVTMIGLSGGGRWIDAVPPSVRERMTILDAFKSRNAAQAVNAVEEHVGASLQRATVPPARDLRAGQRIASAVEDTIAA